MTLYADLKTSGFDTTPDNRQSRILDAPSREESKDQIKLFNRDASSMSLFEFRQEEIRFRWDDTNRRHLRILQSRPFALPEKQSRLGTHTSTETIIWASRVTIEKNGFDDAVTEKILKYTKQEEQQKARIEIRNLCLVNQHHIVAFVGGYINPPNIGLLMFPVATMDLEQFLNSPPSSHLLEVMTPWFSCLCRVMSFLHGLETPIKHRDIKPHNILIDSSKSMFLTDFGISKLYENKAATVTRGDGRFTVKYASPQTFQAKKQGVESDSFSLSCVLLEMATLLLGIELTDFHEYLAQKSNDPGNILYYRDYRYAKGWATQLREHTQNPSRDSYQRRMTDSCLETILDIMTKCAVGQKVDLSMAAKCFDILTNGRECKSCVQRVRKYSSWQ